jgi:phosphoserine phosphatase
MLRFSTVFFDCDSTLSRIEGIEELGAGPRRADVQRLTAAAMAGEIPLEDVFARRLELLRPSAQAIERLGHRYVAERVPAVETVVATLRRAGVALRIVSGGLRPAILPLARFLGFAEDHVAAVDVRFDSAGAYAGFDEESPLARSGGKVTVIRAWHGATTGPRLLVGDGATDAEARGAVDAFVAFAGVAERPAVVAAADHVIRGPGLEPLVDLVLGPDSSLSTSDRG